MKRTITEAQIRAMVSESVKNVLIQEGFFDKAKEFGGKVMDKVGQGINNALDAADRAFGEVSINPEIDNLLNNENWFAQRTKTPDVYRLCQHNFTGGMNAGELARELKAINPNIKLKSDGDYGLMIKVPQTQVSEAINGKYLTHYPERSGFEADGSGWNRGENFNEEEMRALLKPAITAIAKARDYARENGEGKMYLLLNSIIGELHEYEFDSDKEVVKEGWEENQPLPVKVNGPKAPLPSRTDKEKEEDLKRLHKANTSWSAKFHKDCEKKRKAAAKAKASK